uniref:Uncharacterized protein n=1 Tax=Fagus sylvatica TaxID=28930 RepID=A0A2N9FYB2_FAGSY
MADFSSLFSLGYDFCFSWWCRGPVCDAVHRDQWAMGDFLVFSALSHPLRHSLRHWPQLVPPQIVLSVTEFAVDRWITRRGPLGGVEDQLSSTFSGLP